MFDDLIAFYLSAEIKSMRAGNRAAIRKALEMHDQRDVETAIGNPSAGEVSNAQGSIIRPGGSHSAD
jgi:hypothetical protein